MPDRRDEPPHLVDVLIPTYNYGRFIGECLASVASQTFTGYRVFVQDNASNDDTEAIVRGWQDRLDIVYERNPTNVGGARNHELLTAKATARYRIYLHADDLIEPEFLERTVAALESHPQCPFAYTDWTMFADAGNRPIDQVVPFRGKGSGIHRDDAVLLWNNYITPSFTLIRASVMPSTVNCGGMAMLCDHLFAFHMATGGGLYFVDQPLGRYRKHGTSQTDQHFVSGRAMDELCVFYSRIYTTFEYGVPLRLLAKLCEVAKLHGRGLCETYRSLAGDSSNLSRWIAEQRTEIVPLIARVVFAWPTLATERPVAVDMLRELGWERPGVVPDDLADWIGNDRDALTERLLLPEKLRLQDIDVEHFARRIHAQWRSRPRFIFLAAEAGAVAAMQAQLHEQLYGNFGLVQCSPAAPPIAALEAAGCLGLDDWVILAPPGTRFAPEALFALADAINRKPQWQALYADDATNWCTPRFKPDLDLPLLAGTDYLGVIAISATVFQALMAGVPLAPGLPYVLTWQIAGALGEAVIGHVPQCLFLLPPEHSGASPALRRACVDAYFDKLGRPHTWRRGLLPDSESPLSTAASAGVTLIMPGGSAADADAVRALTDIADLRTAAPAATPAAVAAAIADAATDLVLLLVPELRPTDAGWLSALIGTMAVWQAAAVGASVLALDGTQEDAGLVLGVGGTIGPMLPATRAGEPGDPFARAVLPHRVAALSGQCLLLSRDALSAAGGLDTGYATLSGCLADTCLKLHRTGQSLIWTPAARMQRVAAQPALAPEPPEPIIDRCLPNLANDPFWNRNLSLQTGQHRVETDLVARWDPARRDALRVLALPMAASASAEYRLAAPIRALDRLGLAQAAAACQPRPGSGRAPTPVELARLGPDVLYVQDAADRVRLNSLLAAARFNPGILRVLSLDKVDDLEATSIEPSRATSIERLHKALATCQRLIVPTAALAEHYRGRVADIRVVPDRLERALWQTAGLPRRHPGKRPRVGWAGGPDDERDLAILAPVVAALAGEVDWIFFGAIPAGCVPYTAEFHPPVAGFADYPAKLASLSLDLALAPMEVNARNEARSNLRLLEYGFFGWPVIASDIQPFRDNQAPVTRVANRPQDWIDAIRAYLREPNEAERHGRRLADWVTAHYLIEDHAEEWLSALKPIAPMSHPSS